MNENLPRLQKEIRALKYAIVFAGCMVAFALSVGNPRADVATILSAFFGLAALAAGIATKY